MSARAAFRQADVTRLVRGAIKGGMAAGSFKVTLEDGRPVLLPIEGGAALSEAERVERAMKDAFGE